MPWPSGPDGQPLPADPAGQPAWPSDEYRRSYEQAAAQHAAATDRRRPTRRMLTAVLVALLIVVFAGYQAYDYFSAPKKARQDLCQFYRDNNIPPGNDCP